MSHKVDMIIENDENELPLMSNSYIYRTINKR